MDFISVNLTGSRVFREFQRKLAAKIVQNRMQNMLPPTAGKVRQ
jgi:hypothetical protein